MTFINQLFGTKKIQTIIPKTHYHPVPLSYTYKHISERVDSQIHITVHPHTFPRGILEEGILYHMYKAMLINETLTLTQTDFRRR